MYSSRHCLATSTVQCAVYCACNGDGAARMQAVQVKRASDSLLERLHGPDAPTAEAFQEELASLTQEAAETAALQKLLGAPVTLYPALQELQVGAEAKP